MSTKSYRFLWIKLELDNRRFLRIPFPVSLYIFQELLDCFLDLLTIACLFTPKVLSSDQPSRITPYAAKTLVQIVMELFASLAGEEPYELVDVTADKVRVSIQIR
jgi:hypothetical protein